MIAALPVEMPPVQIAEFLLLHTPSRPPVLAKACMCCEQFFYPDLLLSCRGALGVMMCCIAMP